MEYTKKDIEKIIKIMCAASGLSMADVARAVGDSPQNFNNKLKNGKMQAVLDYLSSVADACGFDFVWDFVQKK